LACAFAFGRALDDEVVDGEALEAGGPGGGWGEEAEDGSAFGEAVEGSWLDEDAGGEGGVGEVLAGDGAGDAEDGRPSGLQRQAVGVGAGEVGVEGAEVFGAALADLALDGVALGEPGWEGVLDGGVHGEEGVGDDFEAGHGGLGDFCGAAGDDPGGLHLGEAADLADAGEDEGQAGVVAGGEAAGAGELDRGCGGGFGRGFDRRFDGGLDRVVEEDFVDDEGDSLLRAEGFEGGAFVGGGEVAGRVVGVHEDDGAGAAGDGGAEGFEVDGPAGVGAGIRVKVEGVFAEDDVVELGDEVEEGVAGAGDEDLVAGVAEEAEEEAVGLAGAGGEADAVGGDVGGVIAIVGGDRFSRGDHAERVGGVAQGGGCGEWGEELRGVVVEAAEGGVGEGEVGEFPAGGAMGADGGGEVVVGKVPVGAGGEEVHSG
jgi:hypothetical protein